jgi:hypothetical protein
MKHQQTRGWLGSQTETATKLQAEVDALRAGKAAADSLAGGRGREAADLAEQLASSRAEAEVARSRVAELEGVRRALHNTVLVTLPVSRMLLGRTKCTTVCGSDRRPVSIPLMICMQELVPLPPCRHTNTRTHTHTHS